MLLITRTNFHDANWLAAKSIPNPMIAVTKPIKAIKSQRLKLFHRSSDGVYLRTCDR